jgi:DNA (cytosine-5)-methyltransferase 1
LLFEISSRAALRAALAARASFHGGVPVGAVLVPQLHVPSFFRVLGRSYGKFKAFERLAEVQCMLFHLPPAAAEAFETPSELSPELSDFMHQTGSEYFSGVRHQDPLFGRAPDLPWMPQADSASEPCPADFTFAEVFAGIGGFRLGLETVGGRCVLASEIDAAASEIYAANFGTDELVGDITGLYTEQLPHFDLLTAGFPCQSFSVAGQQEGIGAKSGYGQLYLELVRILRACRPRAFLFENVVGLVTMDGGSRKQHRHGSEFVAGRTFETILGAFHECGYDISWRVVNARHWLPQNRERVYMVGFRKDSTDCGAGVDAQEDAQEGAIVDWEGIVGRQGDRLNALQDAGSFRASGSDGLPHGRTVRSILEEHVAGDDGEDNPHTLSISQWEALRGRCEAQGRR